MTTDPTPDARIDEAAAALETIDDDLPVEEHPAAYEEVHRLLADTLADTAGD